MINIDGVIFRRMLISAANNLYNHYPEIDALNVFPIPDGDTGTNMNATMSSGLNEVFATANSEASLGKVLKAFASGLFNGSRGNSGVILAQFFVGFSKALKDKDVADAYDLADAFTVGKDYVYKSLQVPTEGTILTVIREATMFINEKVVPDMPIDYFFDITLEAARESLAHTPDLLPVLKEVGVVDSGATGFCTILEGFAKALHNEIVEKATPISVTTDYNPGKPMPDEKLEGYCIRFALNINKGEKKTFNEKMFSSVLEALGSNFSYNIKDNVVTCHIHSLNPGNVFTYAQQFGEFSYANVDACNLIEGGCKQGAEEEEKFEEKEFGMIACAVGSGVEKLFKSYMVDIVVSGGQSMNPSTQDFIDAIEKLKAHHVFLFPNNGNIIMAAKQAAEVLKDKYDVRVIPTKTIPQGLTAAMLFNPECSVDENENSMIELIANVKSGEVTYAVRDTMMDGVKVSKGDFIGISAKKILCCCKDKISALLQLVKNMVDDSSSIITVICGEDVTEDEKKMVEEMLSLKYNDDFEISLVDGNQPVYSFFVSVE